MKINLAVSGYDFSAVFTAAQEVLPLYIACKNCGVSAEIEFFSAPKIKALNLKTRGIDAVTDVLSYPSIDNLKAQAKIDAQAFPFDSDGNGGIFIGSIAICKTRAKEQAKEFGHSLEREVCYLALHGFLHLFGFDHESAADKELMRSAEEQIMKQAGLER